MDVSSLTNSGLLGPSAETLDSSASLSGNFDDFLTLLTTQLQNQDPLEPLDANEFTAQLVQFSGVEQAIATNARLDSLVQLQLNNQVVGAVGFLGNEVEANGDTAPLVNGAAEIGYEVPADMSGVTISILSQEGELVRTVSGDFTTGFHSLVWDGLDDNGNTMPEGPYTFRVSGTGADEESTPIATSVFGTVTGVATGSDGGMILEIDGIAVPLADVLSVRQPTVEDTAEG